jgi:hypothetical protein
MKNKFAPGAFGVAAYVFATMSVQMLNHFVINREHYARVAFLRANPIFPLGILSMLVQGTILIYLFPRVRGNGPPYAQGVKYALVMGLFLGSYMIFAEPAKYVVPSVFSWMAVEAAASFLQFLLFGVLLGVIYKSSSNART